MARRVVSAVAPDELDHFSDDADDYFADPAAAIKSGGDQTLGIGIEVVGIGAVAVALYLAEKVVDYVVDRVLEHAERAVRGPRSADSALPALNGVQQAELRSIVATHSKRLDLPEATVSTLADAFVDAFPRAAGEDR